MRQRRTPGGSMLLVALVCTALILPACGPKKEPTLEPEPATDMEPQEAAGVPYDAESLESMLQSLEQRAQGLPGRSAMAHREAMHDVFNDFAQILPMLEGMEPSGAFRLQLRTLQTARDRLAPETGESSVEPAIDTGLRAAYAAFARFARDEEFASEQMSQMVEKLGATVDQLDTVRSVGRPYIAADAVQLMAQITRHMSERLAGPAMEATIASEAAPPAQPAATEPAATEPAATEPAEAPAEPAPDAPAEDPAPAEEMPAEDASSEPGETRIFDIPDAPDDQPPAADTDDPNK